MKLYPRRSLAEWQAEEDQERQRQIEALEKLYAREKHHKVPYVGNWALLWMFIGSVLTLLAAYWVFDAVMQAVGL